MRKVKKKTGGGLSFCFYIPRILQNSVTFTAVFAYKQFYKFTLLSMIVKQRNKLLSFLVITITCLFVACDSEDEKNASLLVDGYEWIGKNPARSGTASYEYSSFIFEGDGYSGRGSETLYPENTTHGYSYNYDNECITLEYDKQAAAYIDNINISSGKLKGTYYSSKSDFQSGKNGSSITLTSKYLKIRVR